MTTSPDIGELATALAKAQAEMGSAIKGSDNPFYRSKYADLASVMDACRGPLTKHGLSVAQFPRVEYIGAPEIYEWISKSGEKRMGVKVICCVFVETRMMHTSGQFIEQSVSAMLASGDPQVVGSAISYLKRYSLQSVAGVPSADDDAESTAKSRESKPTVTIPAGYDEWLLDFSATADNGTAALKDAWLASDMKFRNHLTATDKARYDALKEKAAKVKA